MNVTCEYCGTSYALNNMTLVPSMLKCTQCGASIKVYQPHAKFEEYATTACNPLIIDDRPLMVTSGSSFRMLDAYGKGLSEEFNEYTRSWVRQRPLMVKGMQ